MATRDTWDGSWGTSWATSWTVEVAAPPVIVRTPEPPTGGGGGGAGGPLDMGEESPPFKPIIYVEEPADRFKAQRERSTRVREQLRIALEGPQAAEVRAYVEPEPTDAGAPLHERAQVEQFSDEQRRAIERFFRAEIARRLEAQLKREALQAREQDILDDDDEAMILL